MMMEFFFRWLRERSRAAVLDGIADAVEQVTADGGQQVPPRLAALAASLTPPPALPAADEDDTQPTKPARKRA